MKVFLVCHMVGILSECPNVRFLTHSSNLFSDIDLETGWFSYFFKKNFGLTLTDSWAPWSINLTADLSDRFVLPCGEITNFFNGDDWMDRLRDEIMCNGQMFIKDYKATFLVKNVDFKDLSST